MPKIVWPGREKFRDFLQLFANPWVFVGMNTVLVFLANLLTVAAFPAMSVSLLEVGALLSALVVFGFAFLEYGKPRRQLPALDQRNRTRGRSLLGGYAPHAATGA